MTKRAAKRLPMNFPVTLAEAEAKEFARVFLARMQEPGFFDSGHDAFDPAGAHGWVRRLIRLEFESHPLRAARIVEYAVLGSTAADQVLRELIAEKTEHNEPLGAVLGGYNIRLMNSDTDIRHRHGKSRVDNLVADIVIATLVLQLIERFPPLKSTRFKAWRPSACSIVAEVLAEMGLHRGDEKAIQEVWRRYGRVIMAGYQWPYQGQKSSGLEGHTIPK
jgi:hypothetical protein